jgi:hypothetical protein
MGFYIPDEAEIAKEEGKEDNEDAEYDTSSDEELEEEIIEEVPLRVERQGIEDMQEILM